MLKEIVQFQQALWATNVVASVLLLVVLTFRRNYRAYPAFFFYILANLALGALAFLIYRRWGFTSSLSWPIAWGMQGLVICARALAVSEVCKHLLARYRGIWALAWRTLFVCAVLILLYAALASHQWQYIFLQTERGLELSIMAVIVGVLLFVRHYDVQASPADHSLAIGFCLYSCFRALNDSVLDNYLHRYWPLWNMMEMLAFLASLLLWTWALRKTQTEAGREDLLPGNVYQTVVPQINVRLRLLNEQLNHFWRTEGKKT